MFQHRVGCPILHLSGSGWPILRRKVTSDPSVCGGEICAAGTRIPVTVILDNLAEGATKDEILSSYPSLRPEHVDAALAYAAELAREERLVPIRAR